jgi:hypothetical protein
MKGVLRVFTQADVDDKSLDFRQFGIMNKHVPPPEYIEPLDAERLALEAALAEARADPRASIPHQIVREELRQYAKVARQRIIELAAKQRDAG